MHRNWRFACNASISQVHKATIGSLFPKDYVGKAGQNRLGGSPDYQLRHASRPTNVKRELLISPFWGCTAP